MDLRAALTGQFHAGLAMLRQAIERFPEGAFAGDGDTPPPWHLAYHALFFTHLYLQPDEAAFRPWERHREEYQFLGALPWPPHRPPRIGEPYTRAEVLEYLGVVDGMVGAALGRLDLDAPACGFWWYDLPKLDHVLMNLRHLQHHTAQVVARLRRAAGAGVDWVGARR
jgi:hypothetical protein